MAEEQLNQYLDANGIERRECVCVCSVQRMREDEMTQHEMHFETHVAREIFSFLVDECGTLQRRDMH